MARVVIHHEGQSIALPPGDTIIGRALECRIRFNDPAVSRRHLRLVVRGAGVVAQNLSSSNGTLVNGVEITEPVPLVDGDVLRIGHRRLRIELGEDPRDRKKSLPPVMTLGREMAPGSGIFVDDEEEAAEQTRPGEILEGGLANLTQSLADASREHTCPSCRARVAYNDNVCQRCGYTWPSGRPTSNTQEIKVDVVAVRAHQRFAVEVPVVYSSESLGIDAIVRDISRGGMFLASDLLDPLGTECEITALPDGHPAVRFTGVVAHVVQQSNDQGRPPGLGIKFTGASDEASAWLERLVTSFEQAQPSYDGDATVRSTRIPPDDIGGFD
jgi:hypothetical protein